MSTNYNHARYGHTNERVNFCKGKGNNGGRRMKTEKGTRKLFRVGHTTIPEIPQKSKGGGKRDAPTERCLGSSRSSMQKQSQKRGKMKHKRGKEGQTLLFQNTDRNYRYGYNGTKSAAPNWLAIVENERHVHG